jgi:superfamily II DNA or RNA helicase
MKVKPLTYQIQILKELQEKNKAMIHVASGAGKTHTIAFDIKQKNPQSVLYLVHRNEILIQTVKVFKDVIGIKDHDIGIINQDHKGYNKKYLFATNIALSRPKNLEKIPRNIEYLVIDEFHHAAAPTYQKIIEYFNPKYFYGLTATPERSDLIDIKKYIENNVVGNIDIFTGIKDKILVPFRYFGLMDNIDYSDIRWQDYHYREFDLDKKLLIPSRDIAVINEYLKRIAPENRLTIAFCNSVKHVKRMVEKFNEQGIRSAGITYEESSEQRVKVLDGFRNGLYKVLFTRDILNEGVDFPECSAIMFLRPTFSKIVFLQQLGRGLRKKEGKKDVLVLDFIGNYVNAFLKREYLAEITRSTIENVGSRYKPVYAHDIATVEFDEKVIQIFDIQKRRYEAASIIPTREDLIDQYYELKKANNDVIPMFHEFEYSNLKFRKILRWGRHWYVKFFGRYEKFLHELGERYYSDKQTMVDNYFKVKEWAIKEGHIFPEVGIVTPEVFRLCPYPEVTKYNYRQYLTRFVGWSNFLKFAGELPPDARSPHLPTIQELEYNWNLVKENNKKHGIDNVRFYDLSPTKNPISKYAGGRYCQRFRTWDNVLRHFGQKQEKDKWATIRIHMKKNHGGHTLKDRYYEAKKKLGVNKDRPLSIKEFYSVWKNESHHIKVDHGTYLNMLKDFGELKNKNCVICGKEFLPVKTSSICCSIPCTKKNADYTSRAKQRAQFPDTKTINCKRCGEPFTVDYMSYERYCSKKCGRRKLIDGNPSQAKKKNKN